MLVLNGRILDQLAKTVGFCYVPPFLPEKPELRSRTPRRFNCQPDLAEKAVVEKIAAGEIPADAEETEREAERMRVRPQSIRRYGTPNYCQLFLFTADEIKRGADDASEMGAFHDLFQPQRLAYLRARVDEYTPAGMEAGVLIAN